MLCNSFLFIFDRKKFCNLYRIYRKIIEEVIWIKNVYICIYVFEYLRLMILLYVLNKIRYQFFFLNLINYLVRFLIVLFVIFEDSYMYIYSFSYVEILLYILVCMDLLLLGQN